MTDREALKHLKAVTEAFGPDEGVEFDQKAWSALHAAIKEALARQDVRDEIDRGAKTLRETYLAQPEQEQIQPDKVCIEDDGCPTEKAVLQRFWREHQKTQPEQEQKPAAKIYAELSKSGGLVGSVWWLDQGLSVGNYDLYTTPPQRTWVGLTDQDRQEVFESMPDMLEGFLKKWGWLHFSKATEARLKQKNGYAEEKNT